MGGKTGRVEKGPYEVLDLKALRCFLAAAKNLSLTKAGIELGITEVAVSQRVKSLEENLGVKLYEARGGKVRLTPAGEQTLSFAISLFDEIGEFESALTNSEETGEIVISADDSVMAYLLADVVEKFKRAHPLARLRLLSRQMDESIRLLRTNELDLGVIPLRPLPPELVFRPIATYGACLLTPKGHALARRARADFASLLNEETVGRYPLIVAEVQLDDGGVLREAFARLKLPLKVGIEVGSLDTLKRYVARGLGVAVISELCLSAEDRLRLDVVPVPAELKTDTVYGVAFRRDKHRNPLFKHLLEIFGTIPARPG